jgi:hypothetical protein|nr:MAG TPA: hypothetical protein [Caudoviricetes sp.]
MKLTKSEKASMLSVVESLKKSTVKTWDTSNEVKDWKTYALQMQTVASVTVNMLNAMLDNSEKDEK